MLDLGGASGLMNPQGGDQLEILRMLAMQPEAVIPMLAAAGIPPPSGGMQLAQAGGGLPFSDRFAGAPPAPEMAPPSFYQNQSPEPAVPIPAPGPQQSLDTRAYSQPAPTPTSPLDVRPPAQQTAPGASEVNKLMTALSGVRPPPTQPLQKLDSPRLPATHALPAGSPIAALLSTILGQTNNPTQPLHLGQLLGK